MNHKRGRPKNRRAGCLLCKPQKANGQKAAVRLSPGQRRAAEEATSRLAEANY